MTKINKNTKVFMLTIFVLLVCVITALLIFTVENRKLITKQNQQYFVDDTKYTAGLIDDAISNGYNNIAVLSTLVSDSLDSPEFEITEMQNVIKNSVFDFMEFADKDGMDHNITGGVSDAKDRQYYLDAKEGNSGMELIYVSRATHETLFMFYSPICFENEFVGSLVGVYQASNKVTNLLKSTYFGVEAMVYLADETGRIIASTNNYDPTKVMYVGDLANTDEDAKAKLENCLNTGNTETFTIGENKTGGCIVKLENKDWYVIEIFPETVTNQMTRSANSIAYILILVLLVIYIIIIISMSNFYRKQQKEIETAKNQAEIANQAKTTFLFNMSHDIRTPMNAILGYTDIALLHKDKPDRVYDSLSKIKDSGKHLLNLINDILEMSRIEAGKLEITESPTDLRKSINNISEMSSSLATAKNIDFRTIIGDIENPYVLTDELHGTEVIINLISNAIKYTPDGGTVEFKVEQIGPVKEGIAPYRFSIKDNGIGMSKEFQKHLFENFSREHSTTVSKQEGAGLGLAIVKKIVDMMNGTITVDSKQGEGSTFIVDVPFKVLNDFEIDDFIKSTKDDTVISSNISIKGNRVLLIDDNELNREISSEILFDAGLKVDTAEDGSIAVQKVVKNGIDFYDYILMDIQMPIMDGYKATDEIRKLPNGDSIPIIALSANAFKEDIDRSLEAGMNAHIAKPIDTEKLFETMLSLKK